MIVTRVKNSGFTARDKQNLLHSVPTDKGLVKRISLLSLYCLEMKFNNVSGVRNSVFQQSEST